MDKRYQLDDICPFSDSPIGIEIRRGRFTFRLFLSFKHVLRVQLKATGAIMVRRKEIGLERRRRTRQRLLEAAARVVAHRGEDEATIDHFINEAGLARGTFYNYFPTRKDLVNALWKHVGQDPFRAIQAASSKIIDPAERLVQEARLVVARASQDATWGWLVWYMSSRIETLNEDLRAYPVPDLIAGRAAGRFRFDDENAARDLVVSAVRAAMRTALTQDAPAQYFQGIGAMLLVALGITATEARKLARLPLPRIDGWPEQSVRRASVSHSPAQSTRRASGKFRQRVKPKPRLRDKLAIDSAGMSAAE